MPEKNQYRAIKKPRRCDIAHFLKAGMGRCILFLILLLLLSLISSVHALKQPYDYDDNQCELIAKDYQDKYYGDLIFIQPLKDNGAYDLEDYNGHWINKAWNKEIGIYYIDYKSQIYFYTIEEVEDWYEWTRGQKAEVFNINQEGAPFGIRYHY